MAIKLENVSSELDKIFNDFIHTSFEKRQEALQAGAEVYIKALEEKAPKGKTGEYAKSFAVKTKYKDRRYVGNTKKVKGGGKDSIPLSNILEYDSEGKYAGGKYYNFMRQTYANNESAIFNAIKNKLEN